MLFMLALVAVGNRTVLRFCLTKNEKNLGRLLWRHCHLFDAGHELLACLQLRSCSCDFRLQAFLGALKPSQFALVLLHHFLSGYQGGRIFGVFHNGCELGLLSGRGASEMKMGQGVLKFLKK